MRNSSVALYLGCAVLLVGGLGLTAWSMLDLSRPAESAAALSASAPARRHRICTRPRSLRHRQIGRPTRKVQRRCVLRRDDRTAHAENAPAVARHEEAEADHGGARARHRARGAQARDRAGGAKRSPEPEIRRQRVARSASSRSRSRNPSSGKRSEIVVQDRFTGNCRERNQRHERETSAASARLAAINPRPTEESGSLTVDTGGVSERAGVFIAANSRRCDASRSPSASRRGPTRRGRCNCLIPCSAGSAPSSTGMQRRGRQASAAGRELLTKVNLNTALNIVNGKKKLTLTVCLRIVIAPSQ